MTYMTQPNMSELAEFMQELQLAFDNYEPDNLDFNVKIDVFKWGAPLGIILKNSDGIVFEPTKSFEVYTAPEDKVEV